MLDESGAAIGISGSLELPETQWQSSKPSSQQNPTGCLRQFFFLRLDCVGPSFLFRFYDAGCVQQQPVISGCRHAAASVSVLVHARQRLKNSWRTFSLCFLRR